MSKKEISLVPYENTVYDLLISDLKGKYLQNILAPYLIAQIPEENNLNIHYIESGKLSVWFPLREEWGDISLGEFRNYAIISEEQFKKYKTNKTDLSEIVLAHKDSKAIKEQNKPNLSSKNLPGIGHNVDKSKAKHTTDMKTKDFPETPTEKYLKSQYKTPKNIKRTPL